MKYHPDRNPGDEKAEKKFKEASEAAKILTDDQQRQRYDQFGHAGVDGQSAGTGAGFSDFSEMFGDIFGDFFGGGGFAGGSQGRRQTQRGVPGDDLQLPLSIEFMEAAFGVEKKLKIHRYKECGTCSGKGAKPGSGWDNCSFCQGHGQVRRQQGFFTIAQTCPQCQGQGQVLADPCSSCTGKGVQRQESEILVTVPPGIDSGQRLKLAGEGDAGRQGGPAGDLYVQIHVKDHKFFERDEADIHCTVPISFSQAALGSEVEVPTVGGKVSVKVAEGTQSGKKMRLKAKGLARLGSRGFGDQIITIQVETPSKLNADQKELFKKLSNLEQKKTHPLSKGFLDKVKDLFA